MKSGKLLVWVVVVLLIALAGGGYLGFKAYKQNRPAPVWVPVPVNPDLSYEETGEIIDRIRSRLSEPARLRQVSEDLVLTRAWEMASDEECAEELERRMFVRSGEANTPSGKVPAIHVGVRGKRKEFDLSGKIAMRLMDDVWPLLGIDPPPKTEVE